MTFKKGQSGNPSGRPKVPAEIREALKLTKNEFARLVTKYLNKDVIELQQMLSKDNVGSQRSIDAVVARIIVKCIVSGEHRPMQMLLDRTLGPVIKQLEVETVKPFAIEYRDGSQTVLGLKDDDDKD